MPVTDALATMPLEPTDKFTIAVNDERSYNFFFRRPPLNLRANVYVMLIDSEEGRVVKEEKLCEYKKYPPMPITTGMTGILLCKN